MFEMLDLLFIEFCFQNIYLGQSFIELFPENKYTKNLLLEHLNFKRILIHISTARVLLDDFTYYLVVAVSLSSAKILPRTSSVTLVFDALDISTTCVSILCNTSSVFLLFKSLDISTTCVSILCSTSSDFLVFDSRQIVVSSALLDFAFDFSSLASFELKI